MVGGLEEKAEPLDPERVAYWYFRLNGFLQIENFVVHPPKYGSQRTDADILAVRFPYRSERLIDDANDIMQDDFGVLALSKVEIDFVIAEVKTNQPCSLNGPWTEHERQNVERVVAAIGCVPPTEVSHVAADIYRTGCYERNGIRVRLVAVGRDKNSALARELPAVTQLTWSTILRFIKERLDTYERQKSQVDQWDSTGRSLKQLAGRLHEPGAFVTNAMRLMGIKDK